ncbi:uncharacterized protein LOC141587680 [Silene latifolia]|uniref:uncharacterized protein LOC141587680 n=1 Tax=Silene latifolia TaxID=37657 RepID=UPI003D78279B
MERMEWLHFLATAWGVWYVRNLRTFDEVSPNVVVVIMGMVRMALDYVQYMSEVSGSHHIPPQGEGCAWSQPVEGIVKYNTDAVVFENGEIGLGVVGRDAEGKVIVVGCRRVKAQWEPSIAEAKALDYGVEIATTMGSRNVVMESDAKTIIDAVKENRVTRAQRGLCIADILFFAKFFTSCVWSHVKRGRNTVAHIVARLCSSVGESMYTENFSDDILALAELDII